MVLESINDITAALREQSKANTSVAQSVEQIAQMSERVFAEVSQAASTATESAPWQMIFSVMWKDSNWGHI
ncbi:hypothetical protein [Uliginosibacterium gangwonense]|uniref:hypothetical protein n=1 Tax=Uliginosibacterium gangwonense TaxID=392736 RepID=UPI00036A511D|nr:hypothetical protein [Uliginosibacterium gangwonense]